MSCHPARPVSGTEDVEVEAIDRLYEEAYRAAPPDEFDDWAAEAAWLE